MNGCATLKLASRSPLWTLQPPRIGSHAIAKQRFSPSHTDARTHFRRVLVGETHILIDWSDFSTADGVCTVLMTPAEANRMGVDEAGDDSIPHIVRCARCECPVGTALYQPAGGTVEGSIRIHKDRIALLSASRENVFSKYTICTRLFTELVDRASAHSQYRFLLHACDEVRGDVIGDDGCVTECAGLAGTGLRGRLILLNWNSAVAQCPGGVPDHSHTIISEVSALKLAFDAWDGEPSPSKLRCSACTHVFDCVCVCVWFMLVAISTLLYCIVGARFAVKLKSGI